MLNTRVTEFACSLFCPRVAVDQLSCENRADTILCNTFLACRVSLLVFCCCLCSFVNHAQIEKCGQVIHDDRRTGTRAVLLVAPFGEALRHLSPTGVTSRIVLCWPSQRTLSTASSLSVPTTRRVSWFIRALSEVRHSAHCDRSSLNRAL